MITLAIDTTSPETAAAILKNKQPIASSALMIPRSGSEALLPMIETALSAAKLSFDDVGLLSVAVGPGSFTGVRVGVSLAKGLAFGRELPIAPCDTLEALAYNVAELDGIAVPVMDARRGEVYAAAFRVGDGEPKRCLPDAGIRPESLAAKIAELAPGAAVYLVGDGCAVARPAFEAVGIPLASIPESLTVHSAVSVGKLGLRLFNQGKTVLASALAPLYLREAQPDEKKAIAT